MSGLSPSAWLALSLTYRCLVTREFEKGLENILNEAEGVCRKGLRLSRWRVRASGLELGVVWWGAVLAPLRAAACRSGSSRRLLCPATTGTLVGRGDGARQREHFMVGTDGMSRVRAWPGQGLLFASPVGERLKLSAYSCYFFYYSYVYALQNVTGASIRPQRLGCEFWRNCI